MRAFLALALAATLPACATIVEGTSRRMSPYPQIRRGHPAPWIAKANT